MKKLFAFCTIALFAMCSAFAADLSIANADSKAFANPAKASTSVNSGKKALNSANSALNSKAHTLEGENLALATSHAQSGDEILMPSSMPKAVNLADSTSDEILMPAAAPKKAANPRATKKTTAKKTTAKKTTAKKTTAKTTAKKATTKTAAKKTATKTAAKKQPVKQTNIAKADPTAERGQETQLGLMPSEMDSLNHNVLHANAAAIRGAFDTESALRYIPFVTLINTAGFGYNFDLRGQGRLSANGVQLYINGVPSNPVDNYYSPMPINTVLPHLIQEIEVFPGSGAILYGSGTKGGTINIITSKRQRPYFLVGGGYINTMATQGNSFNAFAHASEKFGSFGVNAGLEFSQLGGPREDDAQTNGQAVLGATWDFALGQKIDLDADFYYGKTTTSPYNSLLDGDGINSFMRNEPHADSENERNRYTGILTMANIDSEDKEKRSNKGEGDIESTQMRLNVALGYENELTNNLKFDVDAFYHLNSRKYDTYTLNLPYFILGHKYTGTDAGDQKNANIPLGQPLYTLGTPYNYSMFLPRPDPSGAIHYFEGQRTDWHFLDQSGSTFTENKFGLKAQLDWKHTGGELIFGLEGKYEISNRNSKNYLRQAIHAGPTGNDAGQNPASDTNKANGLEAKIDSKIDTSIMTFAAFLMENYNITNSFSVMGGARYEMKAYSVKYKDEFQGNRLRFDVKDPTTGNNKADNSSACADCYTDWTSFVRDRYGTDSGEAEFTENFGNFVLELAPVWRYSNTGALYLRGEYGYVAPPAWAMMRRVGYVKNIGVTYSGTGGNSNTDTGRGNSDDVNIGYNFEYEEQDLKGESYWTAEIGWKEAIGKRRIPLGFTDLDISALLFSLNVFYTSSKDEFYFSGDMWSGMQLGNYEKSRRMGAEVALEQILFNGGLSFNESFTYLKAERFYCNPTTSELGSNCEPEWSTMPYVYDYKATFGAAIDIGGYLEIVDVGVGLWIQNSLYGNQTIYAQDFELLQTQGSPARNYFIPRDNEPEKLKPYIISDIGASVNLNKGALVITAGIKNVFDTFYYDYYNNDRTALVNENRYVVGRGRTVFIEGAYKY